MKTAVIHQPDFMPWLGFFDRLLDADLWIVLDHVQFPRGGSDCWVHRDKIKTPQGVKNLSLSVQKAPLQTPINEIRLSQNTDWQSGHRNQIRQAYARADHFKSVFPRIESLYEYQGDSLLEFNLRSIRMILEMLDIDIEIRLSNSLRPDGKSNDMLVDLLRKTGSDRYKSGRGAADYFDPAPFDHAGIEVLWQDFTHPVYPQLHGDFVPGLSAIDLLLNAGTIQAREIVRQSMHEHASR